MEYKQNDVLFLTAQVQKDSLATEGFVEVHINGFGNDYAIGKKSVHKVLPDDEIIALARSNLWVMNVNEVNRETILLKWLHDVIGYPEV